MKIIIADHSPKDSVLLAKLVEQFSVQQTPTIVEGLSHLTNILGEFNTQQTPTITYELATSGSELIKQVEDNWPVDVVIADLNLPEIDGLSALALLKNSHPSLKCILLDSPGKGDEHHEERRRDSRVITLKSKLDLLDAVARNLLQGIHNDTNNFSLLRGLESLRVDVAIAAVHFKLDAYVTKPLTEQKIKTLFHELETSSSFIEIDQEVEDEPLLYLAHQNKEDRKHL